MANLSESTEMDDASDNPRDWVLLQFDIRHFEPLDDRPLTEAVEQLQQTEGSGWRDISDPAAVLRRLRKGANDTF